MARSLRAMAILAAVGCATKGPAPPAPPAAGGSGAAQPAAATPAPATPSRAGEAGDQDGIIDSAILRVAVPEGGPSRGRVDAKVAIVAFNSFEGAWGRQVASALDQLAGEYPDDVRTYFRHCPNRGVTPDQLKDPEVKAAIKRGTFWNERYRRFQVAALAAAAAGAQGKFWEMHDQLFKNQPAFERSRLRAYAAAAGLDVTRFVNDLDRPSTGAVVEADPLTDPADRHLLSALTRTAPIRGVTRERITCDSFKRLREGNIVDKMFAEKRASILDWIAHESRKNAGGPYGAAVEVAPQFDYPVAHCRSPETSNPNEWNFVYEPLFREGSLEPFNTNTGAVRLTGKGWEYLEARPRPTGSQGFIAMAFKGMDHVQKQIETAIAAAGLIQTLSDRFRRIHRWGDGQDHRPNP